MFTSAETDPEAYANFYEAVPTPSFTGNNSHTETDDTEE